MKLALAALCSAGCLIAPVTFAQTLAGRDYPTKPIRVVVAFGPGGVADIVARLTGQKLSEQFRQSVVVDNRPGAGGVLASKLVSAAAPDGYTLLAITGAVAINAVTLKDAIDPRTQLAPIALAASAPTVFLAARAVGARDMMDYARNVKARRFTYATAGPGTPEHLISEYVFSSAGDLDATHVPFGGGGAAILAVLGQQVDLVTTPLPTAAPFIKDGRLRALAVASHKRVPMLPDVPTLAENGFPDIENLTWVAFFGPARMPAPLTQHLNAAIETALHDPQVQDRLNAAGFSPQAASVRDFAEYVRAEVAKWDRVVKKTSSSR